MQIADPPYPCSKVTKLTFWSQEKLNVLKLMQKIIFRNFFRLTKFSFQVSETFEMIRKPRCGRGGKQGCGGAPLHQNKFAFFSLRISFWQISFFLGWFATYVRINQQIWNKKNFELQFWWKMSTFQHILRRKMLLNNVEKKNFEFFWGIIFCFFWNTNISEFERNRSIT